MGNTSDQSARASAEARRTSADSDVRELGPRADLRERPPSVLPPAPTVRRGVLTNLLNKTFVSLYKVVGFTLLGCILFGLFTYIAVNGLFFLHHGWVSPVIVSPSDARVLDLRARLAGEVWNRQKVEAERATIAAAAAHAERTMSMEQEYQRTFAQSISHNRRFQRGQFSQVRRLRKEIEQWSDELRTTTERMTTSQGENLESAYNARLIDQAQKAAGDFRLVELEARRIALSQQKASVTAQMSELARQLQALETVARDPLASTPATLEGLELKRTFMNSVLQAQRARDEKVALDVSATALGQALAGYDKVVSMISESPLLLAAEGEVVLAFIPYDNLDAATPGAPVIGCDALVVWCKRAGSVGQVIAGEVTAKHPVYGTDLRGKYIELKLNERNWAKKAVLHIGHAPLLL